MAPRKKYYVGKSKIQGDGAFAKKDLKPGEHIGKAHTINELYTDYDFTELGGKHNHSENPNVHNVLVGKERHLFASKPIKKGEELTTNYRLQPDLEQPDKFKKGGKLTSSKAKKILHDKEVHGHPLTDKQRKFFGAIAGGAKPYKAESGGWLDKFDAPQAQNGIEGTMGGLTDAGFNYNGAWGGPSMQVGGNIQPAMAGANQTIPMAQKGIRQPIYTSDPQDPRLRAYQDSLSLHNLGKKYFRDTYSHLAGYSTPKLDVWLDDQSDYQKRKDLKYYTISESTFELPWWKSDQKGTSLGRLFNSMANKALSTNILPIGGYYGEGHYPAFKKPVQPVEYKKRVLEKPDLSVDVPENIELKERPQPKTDRKSAAPEPKTISDTPTKYSYTYPTGKYNEQKTIYFPSKSTWKAFVDQFDGLNTTERAGSFEATPGVYTREIRPNPVFKNLKFQMGGVLPGAVGFTYARTAGAAPANGPYAKKTKASAQDGKKLSYSQWKKQYNLKETPDYNLKRAWELGYTPDKTGHLPTVDNQTGQFLKAKGHPTLQLELDWYNSPEGADFRSKNAIDSSGKFFRYVPKGQDGIEEPLTKSSADWYKQWYQQRKALPQFSNVAGKRLALLENLPQVKFDPLEELNKFGAVAYYEPTRGRDASKDVLHLADPASIAAFQKGSEERMGKPYDEPIAQNIGTNPNVVMHEMGHWLTERAPQGMFRPREIGKSEPYEKYPSISSKFKNTGLDESTYRWIMDYGSVGPKTEVNSVLNELRQEEGLRGDQPTTPEQMKKIVDKYMNLPADQLRKTNPQGTRNWRIQTLIKYLEQNPERLSDINNRIVAAPKEGTPTAQNGQEMKFYQEGLDFTPKTISKNGGWLDKYSDNIPQAQGGRLQLKRPTGAVADETYRRPKNLITPRFVENGTGDPFEIYRIINEEKKREAWYNMMQLGAKQANPNAKIQPYQPSEKYKKAVAKLPKVTRQSPSIQAQDMSASAVAAREQAKQDRLVYERQQMMQNSPLAQTMGSFTPSGHNPGAGVIGAGWAANTSIFTAPVVSTGRLTQFGLGQNPYGFGEEVAGSNFLGNTLATLGLLGDIGTVRGTILKNTSLPRISSKRYDEAGNLVDKQGFIIPKVVSTTSKGTPLKTLNQSGNVTVPAAPVTSATSAPAASAVARTIRPGRASLADNLLLRFPVEGLKVNNNYQFTLDDRINTGVQSFAKGLNYGLTDVLFNPLLKLRGKPTRPLGEIFPITELQKYKAGLRGQAAIDEGVQFVKDWTYDKSGWVRPDVAKKINAIVSSGASPSPYAAFLDNYTVLDQNNPLSYTRNVSTRTRFKNVINNPNLNVVDKIRILSNRSGAVGVNYADQKYPISFTFQNMGPYGYSYPEQLETVVHETGHTMGELGFPGKETYEGYGFGKAMAYYDPEFKYDVPNTATEIGRKFAEVMRAPRIGKSNWTSSPLEMHAELMPARKKLVDKYVKSGKTYEEALETVRNASDKDLDWMIKRQNLNRFFKKGVTPEQKREMLRLLPAAVPAVGAAATVLGGEEEPKKQQDGGDIPVDPMGYWNPENIGGPVIIPSNVITMEGMDQPLIGISDTGEVQYMEPGEDYEFDGEYVTEYPVAKKGVSVNKADENPKQKLDQLLNFTNYNKPTKGGWLDKYN